MKRITFEQNYTGADLEAEAADYNEKLRRFAYSPISDIFNVSHFFIGPTFFFESRSFFQHLFRACNVWISIDIKLVYLFHSILCCRKSGTSLTYNFGQYHLKIVGAQCC